MIKVNLLPKGYKIKEGRPELALLGLLMITALFLAATYGYVLKHIERKNLKLKIEVVDKELAQLQQIIAKINQIKKEQKVLIARKEAIEGLVHDRLVYPVFMDHFVKLLPAGMWVLNLHSKSAPGITNIKLDAAAKDNYIISELLKKLELSEEYENIQISGIVTTVVGQGEQIKQFSLSMDYINQEWVNGKLVSAKERKK